MASLHKTPGTYQPTTGPAVWTAADYASDDDWIHRLSPAALACIDKAVIEIKRKGQAIDDIAPEDFDMPALADDLKDIKHILGQGRGFVLIKGIDKDRYSDDEFGIIAWGIGTHIGTGVSQSFRGDRLGNVIDIGETSRYYTRGGPLVFHTDPVDVVGLACLREAVSGGESWVASAMTIHNLILEERPDLVDALYQGYFYSANGSAPIGGEWGNRTPHRVPVYADTDDGLACYFVAKPLREGMFEAAAEAHADPKAATEIGDTSIEAVDYLASVASRPELSVKMDLQPGDIQFLNNRRVMHSRTDYVDSPDPALRRMLYRLWLVMPDWVVLPKDMNMRHDADERGGGIPKSDSVPKLVTTSDSSW